MLSRTLQLFVLLASICLVAVCTTPARAQLTFVPDEVHPKVLIDEENFFVGQMRARFGIGIGTDDTDYANQVDTHLASWTTIKATASAANSDITLEAGWGVGGDGEITDNSLSNLNGIAVSLAMVWLCGDGTADQSAADAARAKAVAWMTEIATRNTTQHGADQGTIWSDSGDDSEYTENGRYVSWLCLYDWLYATLTSGTAGEQALIADWTQIIHQTGWFYDDPLGGGALGSGNWTFSTGYRRNAYLGHVLAAYDETALDSITGYSQTTVDAGLEAEMASYQSQLLANANMRAGTVDGYYYHEFMQDIVGALVVEGGCDVGALDLLSYHVENAAAFAVHATRPNWYLPAGHGDNPPVSWSVVGVNGDLQSHIPVAYYAASLYDDAYALDFLDDAWTEHQTAWSGSYVWLYAITNDVADTRSALTLSGYPGSRYFGDLDHTPDYNGDGGNGPWVTFRSDWTFDAANTTTTYGTFYAGAMTWGHQGSEQMNTLDIYRGDTFLSIRRGIYDGANSSHNLLWRRATHGGNGVLLLDPSNSGYETDGLDGGDAAGTEAWKELNAVTTGGQYEKGRTGGAQTSDISQMLSDNGVLRLARVEKFRYFGRDAYVSADATRAYPSDATGQAWGEPTLSMMRTDVFYVGGDYFVRVDRVDPINTGTTTKLRTQLSALDDTDLALSSGTWSGSFNDNGGTAGVTNTAASTVTADRFGERLHTTMLWPTSGWNWLLVGGPSADDGGGHTDVTEWDRGVHAVDSNPAVEDDCSDNGITALDWYIASDPSFEFYSPELGVNLASCEPPGSTLNAAYDFADQHEGFAPGYYLDAVYPNPDATEQTFVRVFETSDDTDATTTAGWLDTIGSAWVGVHIDDPDTTYIVVGPKEYRGVGTTNYTQFTHNWSGVARVTVGGLDAGTYYVRKGGTQQAGSYVVSSTEGAMSFVITGAGSEAIIVTTEDTGGGENNPPPIPSPTAVAQGFDVVRVSWAAVTDPDGDTVQYEVDFTVGGAGGTDSGLQLGLQYDDTGLDPFTLYSYRVRAFDGTDYSEWSTPDVTVRTDHSAAPTTPANIVATDSTATTLTWDWDDSGDDWTPPGSITYGGQVRDYVTQAVVRTFFSQPTSDYTATGLSVGVRYEIRALAQDTDPVDPNESAYSDWGADAATLGPPTVPGFGSLTPTLPDEIDLVLTASTDPNGDTPIEYYIEETTGSGWTRAYGASLSATFTGGSPEVEYQFRAKARAAGDESAFSAKSAATTLGSDPPADPAAPTVDTPTGSTLDATWVMTSDDFTASGSLEGQVRTRPTAGGDWVNTTWQAAGAVTMTVTNLGPETQYDVQVRLRDDDPFDRNESGWSATSTGTTGVASAVNPTIRFSQTNQSAFWTGVGGDSMNVILQGPSGTPVAYFYFNHYPGNGMTDEGNGRWQVSYASPDTAGSWGALFTWYDDVVDPHELLSTEWVILPPQIREDLDAVHGTGSWAGMDDTETAAAVLDAIAADHSDAGSVGEAISDAALYATDASEAAADMPLDIWAYILDGVSAENRLTNAESSALTGATLSQGITDDLGAVALDVGQVLSDTEAALLALAANAAQLAIVALDVAGLDGVSEADLVDAVWEELQSGHQIGGTMGGVLSDEIEQLSEDVGNVPLQTQNQLADEFAALPTAAEIEAEIASAHGAGDYDQGAVIGTGDISVVLQFDDSATTDPVQSLLVRTYDDAAYTQLHDIGSTDASGEHAMQVTSGNTYYLTTKKVAYATSAETLTSTTDGERFDSYTVDPIVAGASTLPDFCLVTFELLTLSGVAAESLQVCMSLSEEGGGFGDDVVLVGALCDTTDANGIAEIQVAYSSAINDLTYQARIKDIQIDRLGTPGDFGTFDLYDITAPDQAGVRVTEIVNQ